MASPLESSHIEYTPQGSTLGTIPEKFGDTLDKFMDGKGKGYFAGEDDAAKKGGKRGASNKADLKSVKGVVERKPPEKKQSLVAQAGIADEAQLLWIPVRRARRALGPVLCLGRGGAGLLAGRRAGRQHEQHRHGARKKRVPGSRTLNGLDSHISPRSPFSGNASVARQMPPR